MSIFYLRRGIRVMMADANPRLVGAYQNLQRDARGVVNGLRSLAEEHREMMREEAAGMTNLAKIHFFDVRRQLNLSDPASLNGAAHFLFILRTCFNGVYRVNRKGECNIPYGDPDMSTDLVREGELLELGALLKRAEIRCCDFVEAVSGARRGDVVYFDPPYPSDKTHGKAGAFVGYAADGFTLEDRKRLAVVLRDLDARGVRWTLSDAATNGSASAYGLWRVTEMSVRRSVAARGDKRGHATELLVSNW